MDQLIVYVDPKDQKKIKKKRGEHGFISNSAYLRHLIDIDIGKKKPPIQF
jgi:hypothetical protein